MNIREVSITAIKPYEKNARDNSESIDRVAESIREFGFLQPIVCDESGTILAGHTRFAAAKRLGLKTIPVLYAADLSEAQAKAYRLADNKAGDSSKWLDDLVRDELEEIAGLGFDMDILEDVGFTSSEKKRKAFERSMKELDFVEKPGGWVQCHYMVTYAFKTGKTHGISLEKLKETDEFVPEIARATADRVINLLGENVKGSDWKLVTTPRRRHREGFHFATAVCEALSKILNIEFVPDVCSAKNRHRINPEITLEKDISGNLILYDDIITTGETIRATRKCLTDNGCICVVVVSIKN